MTVTPSAGAGAEMPKNADPELQVDFASHQRRWTVLLRVVLGIPHMVALMFVGIAAAVVMVIGWFAALVTGRLPDWAAGFLTGFIAWQARFGGYLMLLTDQYPPFALTAGSYPVVPVIPPHGELNRLAVLFRLILVIPVMILSSLTVYGWYVVGFIVWLIVLVTGRMPVALFLATSTVLRYQLRYQSYLSMITSAYPKKLFGDAPARSELPPGEPATRPLVLTKGARLLVIVFIVLGVLAYVGQVASSSGSGRHSHMTTAASRSN